MKKTVLTASVFLLAAVIIVFCNKVNFIKVNETKPVSNPVAEVANERLPLSAAKKDNDGILEEKEKIPAEKTEENQEKLGETNTQHNENANDTATTETINEEALYCTLSVSCHSVFENSDKLNQEKVMILPQDGIIFPETKVVYYDGESAFNILTRELKKNKIHIDFVNSPIYNTVYIKGISNLYEKDCGELSGWLYMVNGTVPGYGCSQYILKPGDKIEFIYTCNSGRDVAR